MTVAPIELFNHEPDNLLPFFGSTRVSMIALAYALGVLAALLLVPVAVLVLQVLSALRDPAASERRQARRQRVAVLVPAHNEASVIGATLRSVVPEMRSGD